MKTSREMRKTGLARKKKKNVKTDECEEIVENNKGIEVVKLKNT